MKISELSELEQRLTQMNTEMLAIGTLVAHLLCRMTIKEGNERVLREISDHIQKTSQSFIELHTQEWFRAEGDRIIAHARTGLRTSTSENKTDP